MEDMIGRGANGGISNERYRSFIEDIREGLYEVDLQGYFTYFNSALCQVFGFPREEIHGHHFSKFMTEANAKTAYEIFSRIYQTGGGFSDVIWEIIDKQGQTRIIELSAELITDHQGNPAGFRGIARDVTARFKAQEALRESEWRYQCQYEESRNAEQRYRRLLDFVPYPMVVSTEDGSVTYLNPAFTEVFGWTLSELKGKHIPYVPPECQEETRKSLDSLLKERFIRQFETKRLTKDGRVLDVRLRGTLLSDQEERDAQLVILRDVTHEKWIAQSNEALLRISMTLPAYSDLEDLLDYISVEIKRLLNTQGALVILLDEEKHEFYFLGAAHDDKAVQKRAKTVRWSADRGIAGRVLRTGKEMLVPDTALDPDFYGVVDHQVGFVTRNMLDVPLRAGGRIIGVLCAMNKKEGLFDRSDAKLLNMVAGTVALSVENARYSEELRRAYTELQSMNRAKDKVINHLSHELKTPVAILSATLNILSKRMAHMPREEWEPTLERARRNLGRILEMQYQVEDIMRDRHYVTYKTMTAMVEACRDELEALVSEACGEVPLIDRIQHRIDELFGPKESPVVEVSLDTFIAKRLEVLKSRFSHRDLELRSRLEPTPHVCMPEDVLQKVIDGIIKNAIENTPDEGRIEVLVSRKGDGSELVVHDYGVGITEENEEHLFEGFLMTQETMVYSSKRPFDFNAGGKGMDLLRMKIFSERYNFRIDMESTRCRFIPTDRDQCPGKISQCGFCKDRQDCRRSGGTVFTVFFPPMQSVGCAVEGKAGD